MTIRMQIVKRVGVMIRQLNALLGLIKSDAARKRTLSLEFDVFSARRVSLHHGRPVCKRHC